MTAFSLRTHVHVPYLWKPVLCWTSGWGDAQRYDGGCRVKVRCGQESQRFLDPLFPRGRFGVTRDASQTLMQLWKRILPHAEHVFTGSYSPPRMFAHCDYIMEGAFLFGVIVLSKKLGNNRFPCGVYGRWPPELPEHLRPEPPSALIDVD